MDLTTLHGVGLGHVIGQQGAAGSAASAVTYDFQFWDVVTRDPNRVNAVSPKREVPPDMEVATLAPLGWPAMRSFLNGVSVVVLWPGGETYGVEECTP